MKNGTGMNEGGLSYLQGCVQNGYGYPTHQGMMILPKPGRPDRYVLLHLRKPNVLSRAFIEDLLYSEIDMAGDSGLGEVVEKNTLVARDTFCDMLTGVRHGNGRDWWLVLPRYNTGQYYVFLLSPGGVTLESIQTIGEPLTQYSWSIQATFSPDGTKYANHSWFGGLQIFDFDRCTGGLSNAEHITFPGDTIAGCGVAISSNSRYLYASNTLKLYQFDLYATRNVEATRQLVGVYDGFVNFLPTTFYQMMLAPDKKIYMTCTYGTKYWHIIHQPDKRGLDCDLEQHFELPTVHGFSPPNFPHFRLFDLHDSPCDTLGINGPPPPKDTLPPAPDCAAELRLYPNPASGHTWVELPYCRRGGQVTVWDVAGRLVQEFALEADEVRTWLDVSGYVPGVYFVQVRRSGQRVETRLLSVVR